MPPKKVICILTKEIYSRMRRFDYSTMPMEQAVAWDPTSIAGQAITNEKWKNVPEQEKQSWLMEMNSASNLDTYVSKLLDFDCFVSVVIRGSEVFAKFIVLSDFQRFTEGPIFYGPYNWPDPH